MNFILETWIIFTLNSKYFPLQMFLLQMINEFIFFNVIITGKKNERLIKMIL